MAVYPFEKYSIGYTVVENSAPCDLVFLNGNLATSRWWLPTVEKLKSYFSNLPLNGRMIFIELPGCGASSAIESNLNISQITQQYVEILKHLNVQSASIIGHSTGGLLSCLVAARVPDVFKKALLLDPVPASGIQFDNSVLEKYEEMKTNKELTAAIIGFTIRNCDMQSSFFKQIIVEDTFDSINKLGSKIILALRGYDSSEEIKKVKADVTILFGQDDILLPKADIQKLTTLIPVSRFIEVPEAGHCLNVENPALMADYIHKHLFN